jgi:hypothetical protein
VIAYDGVRLTSQNSGHHWPTVHPPGECKWRAVVIMIRLGITPDLSTRARWQSYQQRHLEGVGGMDEGVRILRIQYLWYVSGSFTCRQILRHRSSGFTSHPKENVLRDFIALKNPSPQPGLNPRPFGAVASTLTAAPTRRQATRYESLLKMSNIAIFTNFFITFMV